MLRSLRFPQCGFTLIELMVVIAILGILLTIALPAFSDLIQSNRTSAQANDFISAISAARSEAVRRGLPVCLKRTGTTAKDWSGGWEVFVDGTTARTFTSDSNRCSVTVKDSSGNAVLLQSHSGLTGGNTLKSTGTAFETSIRFNAMGVAADNTGSGITDSFVLCRADKPAHSKQITVSVAGLISTVAFACN